jgi:hypothetical protein
MAGKRIILLLDGTWNDADFGAVDTNVVRLRELIAHHLGATGQAGSQAAAGTDSRQVRAFRSNGKDNFVFYERGVGTNFSDRLKGGIFGDGLGDNIRRAYKFLSFYYEPGDEIFLFGFSRGSFTARSLVGYIHAVGLLRRDQCTRQIEKQAWRYYRTAPNDRLPGIWADLGRHTHDRNAFKIACVAVFDTVGELGIPLTAFTLLNRDRFEFHNVELASITETNLQALAIDEHRQTFAASIWRKPKFKQFATRTEQVWFAGAHADIGGGYIVEETRAALHPRALDDITLDWMIKRLLARYPDFPIDAAWAPQPVDTAWSAADQHDQSHKPLYRFFPSARRAIANLPIAGLPPKLIEVCHDRHADAIAEMVHISALERLGTHIKINGQPALYAPKNLLAVLPVIEATYGPGNPFGRDILVVDWDGIEIDPKVGAAAVRAVIETARDRLPRPSRSP